MEQQIRERAFHLSEQDGCPYSRPDDHWVSAEGEIRTAAAQPEANKALAEKVASPRSATRAHVPRSHKPAAEMRH